MPYSDIDLGQHWIQFIIWISIYLSSVKPSDIRLRAILQQIPGHHSLKFVQITKISLKHIEAETKWRHFADDLFKRIFFNGNVWISIKISLKFVPQGPINDIPALAQIMAGRGPGDKPLSEPMMVRIPTHICVTRPQWVKRNFHSKS